MKHSVYTTKRFSALNIDNIGFSDDPNITKFGPGIRRAYFIFYVIDGKGFYNNHHLHAGQGFITYFSEISEYHADPDDPWTILWVSSEDRTIEPLLNSYNAVGEHRIFEFDYAEKLTPTLELLRKWHSAHLNRAEMLEIYMSILKHHIPNETASYKRSQQLYVDTAVNYIQNNYQLNISVKDLTNLLGISQPYLYNLFTEYLGVAPKNYIIDYRINKAMDLFIQTDLSVKYVASSVGYHDQLAFSKIFTQKTGISPMKFKKMHKKG